MSPRSRRATRRLQHDQVLGGGNSNPDASKVDHRGALERLHLEGQPRQAHLERRARGVVAEQQHLTLAGEGQAFSMRGVM